MKNLAKWREIPSFIQKIVRVMKISVFLVLVCTLQLSASVILGQQVSLQSGEMSVRQVFKELKTQTGTFFMYSEDEVDRNLLVDVDFSDVSLEVALDEICEQASLNYEIVDDYVLITKKALVVEQPVQQEKKRIKGKITDKSGLPLPGVSVLVKGTYSGVATDKEGIYIIDVPEEDVTLVFSFVGMETQEVVIGDQLIVNVVLKQGQSKLEEVTIRGGIFERRKESFTGTATVVEAEELKAMGTDNLIKSLSLIDPSFNIIENNISGSDPNALPEIRLRGSSILSAPGSELNQTNLSGDPNLPTFILDDFETSLQSVLDLDMNRVESVTILKDAAATAFYGSRAANGVIVIRTKQPESGKLQVSYNLSTDFSFPDLESYDLLNASELFELQKDLNILQFKSSGNYRDKASRIEQFVASGVDTDWIGQPVRNSVGQKHSLNLMGGDNHMRYMFDLSYANRPGVMKGSSKETMGLAASLLYKVNDKISFKNRLSVDRNNSADSPYGSFDYYAKMQPYFPIHDEDGNPIERYAIYDDADPSNSYHYFNYYNPLYESTVGNENESTYMNIVNNFSMDWRILSYLKFKANISYTHTSTNNEWFRSPESHYYWNETQPEQVGEYRFSDAIAEKYQGNATLSFMEEFNGHFINALLGVNVLESSARELGFSAQGFAAKGYSDPSFAAGYGIDGLPSSSESTTRLIGGLASINYSYKNRYLFDFTYKIDGSSQFGSEDKTAEFYSVGLGWNLHHEDFLKNSELISLLRIKGTTGETGSVNFSAYQAKDIVQYYTDSKYLSGLGTYLKGLGNDRLKWQTTETMDLGLELGLFDNRLSMTVNYYEKTTTDMITPITTPPSLGFSSYLENLGEMENTGFEFALRAQLIKKQDFNWNVHVSGSQNRSRIVSIGNSLKSYNELGDSDLDEVASHSFLVRFEEGKSNSAIWAVKSLGIDPATGKELFLTKEGLATFNWNPKDKIVVGDIEPDLRGTFGTNVSYKAFNLGLAFAYEFGGQIYNTTLVDKVENSPKEFNVDRRVLEETWKNPGDVVKYKTNYDSRGIQVANTPSSSRFVQDQNLVRLSSINMNYNIPNKICEKLKTESMRLSFNMNDVFYWSTVQRERGFSYPFARSFSIGLRANF
ncbi:SusC/RagA family TonB-linked outer membrane protein [Ancylomarina sp. DW003]|nr:SusC/RagA family TonB-linked outer membrane protein [Ancylomarina sp. DW003]MDE5422862.1 SusC/RagA family TonB-linked outer membrane protein [Ancylomarina sp. DW003]